MAAVESTDAAPTRPGWRGGVAIGAVLAALALLGGEAGLAAVAVLTGLAALYMLPAAAWFMPPFFAALAGLCVPVNEFPAILGGIRFYAADGLFFFLAALAMHALLDGRALAARVRSWPRPVRLLLAAQGAYLVWGLFAMALGFTAPDHTFRDIMGDYRRLFFYSLGMTVCLMLPSGNGKAFQRLIHAAVLAAFAAVMITGLYRLATGQTFNPDKYIYMATFPTPRLFSYAELPTLGMGLAYGVAAFQISGRPTVRLLALAASATAALLLAVSGWRMAYGFILAAPACGILAAAYFRGGSVRALVARAFALALAAAPVAAAAAALMAGLAYGPLLQTLNRFRDFSLTEDMRYYAWGAAFRKFANSPVIGDGLGDVLTYANLGSEGTFFWLTSSTHSMPITILYQTGLLGAGLFIAMQAFFWIAVLRYSRSLTHSQAANTAALLAIYGATLLMSAFEPLYVGSILMMYMAMGLALRTVLMRRADLAAAESDA